MNVPAVGCGHAVHAEAEAAAAAAGMVVAHVSEVDGAADMEHRHSAIAAARTRSVVDTAVGNDRQDDHDHQPRRQPLDEQTGVAGDAVVLDSHCVQVVAK